MDWTPPNPDYPPPKAGEPPLHRAARLGDGAEIRRLIAGGADPNAVFDIGLDPGARPWPATPLMVAAGSGDGADEGTVRLMIELGADPAVRTEAGSAATFACGGLGWNYRPGGGAARLRAVLEGGAPLPPNPEWRNEMLCDAAGAGDAEMVGLLLSLGFDARGHFDPAAARALATEVRELMAKYAGAMPDPFAGLEVPAELRDSVAGSMARMDAEMVEAASAAPRSDQIPLHRAVRAGSADCVAALLKAGADPVARDNERRTAMYSATNVEVVRALARAGCPIDDADDYGWSPLVAAVREGEWGHSKASALIAAGADVNAKRDEGYTVFMSAVGTGRWPATLRALVAAGADPHALTEEGCNAFHAAIDVARGANPAVSVRDAFGYLRDLGVDMEARTAQGLTPLLEAVMYGSGEEVRVLCEFGADPNAIGPLRECGQDACTTTMVPALHLMKAHSLDAPAKMRALLEAGADACALDPDGYTALARVVAALCAEGDDYAGLFTSFFTGLRALRLPGAAMPAIREEFVALAEPVMLDYVRRFAAPIPVPEGRFRAEWRESRLACIAMLVAYEGWARHRIARGRAAGSADAGA